MSNDHRRDIVRSARLDDDPVSTAVREINRIYATKTLETYIAIGKYVLDTFFEGDFTLFRSRGRSDPNMKALAARDDLMVSATTLWRSVAVLEQSRQLPGEVARELSISHHLELLRVKDEEDKENLARSAVEEGMSRGRLAEEVREVLGDDEPGEPERPEPEERAPRAMKALAHVGRAVEHLAAVADEGGLEGIAEEEQREALKKLDEALAKLRRVRQVLGIRVRGERPGRGETE